MSMLVISVILSNIASYFSHVSPSAIQLLATFPDLIIMIFSILSGLFLKQVSSKRLMQLSCLFFIFAGFGGVLIEQTLVTLFVWSFCIGAGIGTLIPSVLSAINHYLQGNENLDTIGKQSMCVSLGAILLTLLAGLIVGNGSWQNCYALFLCAGLICLLISAFVPKKSIQHKTKKRLDKKIVAYYSIFVLLFFSVYNIFPVNIAFLLEEKGWTGQQLTSICTCMLLLGSVLSGFVFSYVYQFLRSKTLYLGIFTLFFGMIVQYVAQSVLLFQLGLFVAGISLSLIMACCTSLLSMKQEDKDLAVSIMMAFSDGGGFVTSVYSFLTILIFRSFSVNGVYLIGMLMCFLLFAMIRILKIDKEGCVE